MNMEERINRLELAVMEMDAHLTAITYINRALLPMIRVDRGAASQLLTTAFDAMERQAEEQNWGEEHRAAARQAFDLLAAACLCIDTPGHRF